MKRLLFFLLAGAVALAAVGSGSFHAYKILREHFKKYETVRLADSGPDVRKIAHYLALKKSFYEDQSLKVKRVECRDDREALAALESGKADAALVRSSSLVIKKASKLKEGVGPVAFASLDRGTSYHLVARENKPLADIQSLKNKTVIAGPQDSTETVFFESVLRDLGLSPYEAVTIITNIPEDLRMGALKAGTGHYLLVEEKDLPAALARGFFLAKSLKAEFPSFVCVTSRDFAGSHPETLQKFTNALYMSQIWMKHHTPAETAEAVGGIAGIGKETFPGLVARYYEQGSLPENPVPPGKGMETVVKMLDRAREIPMTVKTGDLVSGGFAENSVKTVKYIPEDKKENKWLQKLKFWQ